MDDSLDDLLPEFIEEAEEHLQTIEADLLEIENGSPTVDHDLVNKVFRGVHSIKGAAGFLELQTIGELAHALESVLDQIRTDSLTPAGEIIDALLSSADVLRALVRNAVSSNERDVTEFVERLQGVLNQDSEEEGPSPPDDAERSTPVEQNLLQQPAVGSEPSVGAAAPVTDTASLASPPATATATANRGTVAPEATIRVSVSTLDRLMNLAGELVIGRNQLQRVVRADIKQKLEEASHRIDQVTSELQESVMQTRMQPVGTVFSKFPRVVRELCKRLGKQAELVTSGEDVDLDRSLIEAIGDPLMHLVRNAVDHGIEKPETRLARGKSAVGRIELSAFHDGGKVLIVIRDDGGGIDPDRIRLSAIEKGILDEAQAASLDDREAVNLIFRAGFSTASEVTDVSGRGVGMDVVRSNFEALGSTIEITSSPGSGSCITVKVPLTLAIMDSVIVSQGGQTYAFPRANVREMVGGRAARRIEQVAGQSVLRLRGSLLPIVHFSQIIGSNQPAMDPTKTGTVVVLDSGTAVFGLCIDGRPDLEEIVVKPLGKHLQGFPELGGGTILGDGSAALILDVNGIASGLRLRCGDELLLGEEPAAEESEKGKLIEECVLFTGHPEELFALPLLVVARIDRVSAEDVRRVGGKLILELPDGIMPLLRPEDALHARPIEECSIYHLLVTRVDKCEFGILVDQIEDIRKVDLNLDATLAESGVFGSFHSEGRTVRLLDTSALAWTAFPDWFATAESEPELRPLRVLLAEDSKFVRNQVTTFLEGEGIQVTAFEDGAAAWGELGSGELRFDLLLTDIEMPNMDGLQLTRLVKADPRFANMPVIALTSLSSDADVERGRLAGLDDYQVKLDKSGLMRSIRKHTNGES